MLLKSTSHFAREKFCLRKYCLIIFSLIFTICSLSFEILGQGTIKNVSFYCKSVKINRGVQIYLPQGYNQLDSTVRYPVIYFLHGATVNHTYYAELFSIFNNLIAAQSISPLIVVKPDGSVGPYTNSYYTNSELYGNFEDYIVLDLVEFIDSVYNTIPSREKRAIMGHSTGAFGAMKLALKHPDVYSGVAAHSGPLDFKNFSLWIPGILSENRGAPVHSYRPSAGLKSLLFFSMAGAFSPNLNNSPEPVDFPLDSLGHWIDSIWNSWSVHDPAFLIKSITQDSDLTIFFDCGTQDEFSLYPFNIAFADSLDKLGLPYVFQSFNGDHTNQLVNRFPIAFQFLDSVMITKGNRGHIHTINASINRYFLNTSNDVVNFTTNLVNNDQHEVTANVIYTSQDNSISDSTILYDDGQHGDSLANDNLRGAFIQSISEENYFNVSTSTLDKQSGEYYHQPNLTRFTTAGPLKVDSVEAKTYSNTIFSIKPFIKNGSERFTFNNLQIKLLSNDTWVTQIVPPFRSCPTIAPGEVKAPNIAFAVYHDSANFSTQLNLRFELSKDGWTYWTDSMTVNVITGVEEDLQQPLAFKLEQNYPNPFNPSTKISWQSPVSSWQTLKVFDVIGNEVATLADKEMEAGYHSVDFDASYLPSGVYFYRLQAGGLVVTKKMILLR